MMPEEWPIAASTPDPSAQPRAASRSRLSTVRIDFFLDPTQRLTEQERALMTVMLHQLVCDLARALRAALPGGWLAANDEDDAALVERLASAGLLDEPGLIALLLQRADEERISTAARARGPRREARVLQGLVSNPHGAVASAAMALILARGRRRDRFGQCLMAFDDLSDQSAELLVNAVAAGLREELAAGRGAEADRELASAVHDVLAQRDSKRGVGALTVALIDQLEDTGALNDGLALSAANEGEVTFVAAMLAHRAAIGVGPALDDFLSGDSTTVMALLRAAGTSRELAAGLLAALGDLLGLADVGEAVAAFDAMTSEDADRARSWLATGAAYRSALERLGHARG